VNGYIIKRKYKLDRIRTIALYIPVIDIGGAERQFIELAKGLDKKKWSVLILTNSINTSLESEVNNIIGVRVVLLSKNNGFVYAFRLLSVIFREKPSIINSYLVSAQTYTLFLRPFFPKIKVVFSVRDSLDYSAYYGSIGFFFNLLIVKSSSLVDCYIFNAVAGRNVRNSLPDDRVQVIPNGIDTNKFYPDPLSHNFVRKEAGIGTNVPVVGIVSNFSIYKGYKTFILAARIVAEQIPGVHFVCIGNYDTPVGEEMQGLVRELGLFPVFHFLGSRPDVPKLLPGMDILCSSSVTEGFSNSICEGMASGVPCVVTNVGDSALIVDDTGIIVPVENPGMMAEGILKLLMLSSEERKNLGIISRNRIERNFSISRMVSETEKVFESLLRKECRTIC